MFHKRPSATGNSTLDSLRTELASLKERSHELERRLLNVDMRYTLTDATHRDQLELSSNRSRMAVIETDIREIEQEQARAHAERGKEEHARCLALLRDVLNKKSLANAATRQAHSRHAEVAQMVRSTLAEWPEHLANLNSLLPKYEDDATMLGRSAYSTSP